MPSRRSAFTLIELLVVIAIIAILAVVVVLVLNPAQLLAQSRDSNRVSDLATISSALNLYQTDLSGTSGYSLGTASSVAMSYSSASSTCGDLGLPSMHAGYSWHCAPSASYRKTDGTGWIPVDFSSISSGAPFGSLPIDPANSTSSGLYYTYTTNGTQYELTAAMESTKYKAGGSSDVISGDGASLSTVYAKGTNLTLEPLDYGITDPTLVGWWPLNEGSGNIAYDGSGQGQNGTWAGSAAGTSGHYSAGYNEPWSGVFDGSTDYIPVGTATGPLNFTGDFTFAAWINIAAFPASGGTEEVFSKGWNGSVTQYELSLNNNQGACGANPDSLMLDVYPGYCVHVTYPVSNFVLNTWYFVAGTFNGSAYVLYVNGVQVATTASTVIPPASGELPVIGGSNAFSSYGGLFHGLIQDLRTYNRALSAGEIAALYAMGR